MKNKRSTKDRLELFVARVNELSFRRLIQQGMQIEFSYRWDAATQALTHQIIEPDEEDLRSFMLLFRQFVSEQEPVFISRIFNDSIRLLTDEDRRQELKKAKDGWNNIFNKSGPFEIVIDSNNLTGEYVLDLWINGSFFHNDEDKARTLVQLTKQPLPLLRMKFLSVLPGLTQVILYVGMVVEDSLRKELFDFTRESK